MAIALLHKFILDSLNPEQLWTLLRTLDHVKHLLANLPAHESISATKYTSAVIEELGRDGSFNRAFFDALRAYRPNRTDEIDAIAGHFCRAPRVEPPEPASRKLKDTGITPVWAPPGAPDGPAEAELRPTLGEWCAEHRGKLTLLLAFPIVGVIAAFGLGRGSPDVLQIFTAKPWAPLVLAAQIGQMLLSGFALFVFAGWIGPDHPSPFAGSPTYARFATQKEAALGGDVALRAALGAAADEPHMGEWLKGARRGGRQLSEQLVSLWLTWALLYFCLVAGDVAPLMFGAPGAGWRSVIDATSTMLNNATSGVMLIIFWVMTYVTVPIQHVGPQGFVPRQSTRVRFGVRLAVLLIFAAQLWATNVGSEAARQAWKYAFELLSGVGASVIMALLFGRFDSKLLNVPLSALVCLYIWAAIQASWPVLDLIHLDGRPETERMLKDIAQVVLYSYAWFAKCVFFVLCAWLFHTGRFEFFLLRLRRMQTSIAADWRRVTQASRTPGAPSSPE